MMATKRKNGPRPETLRRRAEILQAAMEVFGAKGFANGTLHEIAEQVDMTHAGVLHHFGSKTQLLVEVLSYRDQSDVQDLADKHIPGGMELFRHLVRTAFANARRAGLVQAYAVLSGESVTDDHPARSYFQDRYRTLRHEVTTAFALACEEKGVTQPETIADAAAAILAVMDGLQIQWLLDPDAVDLARSSEFAIEAIVCAVLDPHDPVL
nr:TetR/AcrR family transcriptional regulator [Microbacterium stercoris]